MCAGGSGRSPQHAHARIRFLCASVSVTFEIVRGLTKICKGKRASALTNLQTEFGLRCLLFSVMKGWCVLDQVSAPLR